MCMLDEGAVCWPKSTMRLKEFTVSLGRPVGTLLSTRTNAPSIYI